MDLSMYHSCQGLVDIAIAVISEAACVSRSKIVTEVTSEQTNTQQEKQKLEEEDKNEDENRTKAGDKNKTKTRIMVMAKKYQNKRGPEHNNR